MLIDLKFRKRVILFLIILLEFFIGSLFLFNFYQQKIFGKLPDEDKIAVIKKENLIFPSESEFKHYYEFKPNYVEVDSPDWLSYEVKYNINADGLNERFDYFIEKPEDAFRIITLGDSFTYGHYVDTKNNWPEQLEDLLNSNLKISGINKFEVINLGMPGFDIPYIVKRYKDIGAKYKPDLVIWFESGSGFIRLNELMSERIGNCEENRKDISASDSALKPYYYCWNLSQKEINDEYSYEEIEQITTFYLDSFFSFYSQEKTLFFTFENYNLDGKWIKSLEKWRERYPHAVFSSSVPGVYGLKQILPDGHPNKDGHKTIAFSIYEYLKKNVISGLE